MILLLTKDLFFVPTLQTAAEQCGTEIVTALRFESAKVDALQSDSVSAWIIDLSSLAVEDLARVVAGLRERFPRAKSIAFGPHVQERRLDAAREAGCSQVLTRGQLNSQVQRLMADWI